MKRAILRNCGGCAHWQIGATKTTEAGYAVAQCCRPIERTTINHVYPYMRASDHCSAWTKRLPPPVEPDLGFG